MPAASVEPFLLAVLLVLYLFLFYAIATSLSSILLQWCRRPVSEDFDNSSWLFRRRTYVYLNTVATEKHIKGVCPVCPKRGGWKILVHRLCNTSLWMDQVDAPSPHPSNMFISSILRQSRHGWGAFGRSPLSPPLGLSPCLARQAHGVGSTDGWQVHVLHQSSTCKRLGFVTAQSVLASFCFQELRFPSKKWRETV